MNLTYPGALALISEIADQLGAAKPTDPVVVVCPPFPFLSGVGEHLPKGGTVHLGAQNAHHKEGGAYTGEVEAKMLVSVGCEYVILGHSERRQHFREDDALLGQKLKTVSYTHLTLPTIYSV